MTGHVKLSNRQAWLLDDIQRTGFEKREWFRPMDIGGRNGSDHSNILKELISKGLIERRPRCGPRIKSYVYRLTKAGREWRFS